MAITRGELPPGERSFFKLDEDEKKTPALQTEAEVIEWGNNIINGEEIRKAKGRSQITNPTIAVVKVRFEQFIDSCKFQKTLQKNYHRALEKTAIMRPTADEIILQVWNEVEKHFSDLSDEEKRAKSTEYGISYVYRKNEPNRFKN
jgi:hypothetical protein